MDYLYRNYENKDNINRFLNFNEDESEKNFIDYEDEKNNIFNSFLNSLRSFFSNNPNKTENINNLKIMLKDINVILIENDNLFFLFYRFINKYISKDLELYLVKEQISGQISVLIKVVNNLIQSKLKLNNDRDKHFIIKNLEIPNGLIPLIIKGIKTIFPKYLLTPKKEEITGNEISLNKDNDSENELDKISDFYQSIFEIFKFILEDLNVQNENKINNEKEILELFIYITKIMKAGISEKNSEDSSPNIKIEYSYNFSNIIFCSINFLKFYYYILSKHIYQNYFRNDIRHMFYLLKFMF